MCGILAIQSREQVMDRLVEGLSRLTYRGYDSSGLATVSNQGIDALRAVGHLENLEQKCQGHRLQGVSGIAHTRWATHGVADEKNAHPHWTDRVAVVHNGIIENFLDLKNELLSQGCIFQGDTDTEVILHLLDNALARGLSPIDATFDLIPRLKGSVACSFIFRNHPSLVIAVRQGHSPLAVGQSSCSAFVGSDAVALAGLAEDITYLESGDIAILEEGNILLFQSDGTKIERASQPNPISAHQIDKGGHPSYTFKEIQEQPRVLGDIVRHLIQDEGWASELDLLAQALMKTPSLTFVGCGTAYYAGCIGALFMKKIAHLSAKTEVASEFEVHPSFISPHDCFFFISQSGETADTMAALKRVEEQKPCLAALTNVRGNSIERLVRHHLALMAGPEIGVASTKAFTAQVCILTILTLAVAAKRNLIDPQTQKRYIDALKNLSQGVEQALTLESDIQSFALSLTSTSSFLFLGRGIYYPVALEGALKMKELSYIHAEGYPAGELKHGPIALIDKDLPVIIIAPYDDLFQKNFSNIEELLARGAQVTVITNKRGGESLASLSVKCWILETDHFLTFPILSSVLLQLLAYHTALARGANVDCPRNLAKSVTVE